MVRLIAQREEISQANLKEGQLWSEIAAEARPLVSAGLISGPTLIITPTHDRALQWQARLLLCGLAEHRLHLLPSGQSTLFDDAAPETIALSDRIAALRALVNDDDAVVIAPAPAALERTIPLDLLEEKGLRLATGLPLDIDESLASLVRLGYDASEPVRVPGQFSRRGGILDVFPMGATAPVRVELFGDEIESLRTFDPMTQRSTGKAAPVSLAPSRETLLTSGAPQIADMVRASITQEADVLPDEEAESLEEKINADADALEQGAFFDRLDLYRPLIHAESGSAASLLQEKGLLILDEPFEIEAYVTRAQEELGEVLASRAKRGEILHSSVHDFVEPIERLGHGHPRMAFAALNDAPEWLEVETMTALGMQTLEAYRGEPVAFAKTLHTWRDQGVAIAISTDQPTRAKGMLAQAELHPSSGEEIEGGEISMVGGNLGGGFLWPEAKLAVVSDQELFGVKRLKLPQRTFSEGVPVSSVLDLAPGDYVVHINFGVGIYRGLATRTVDGVEREFLHVEYKEPDKLFVPADQLDRIHKYLAPGDAPPRVNKLSGNEWQKTVKKAREDAREFAKDLIRLYAERRKAERDPVGADSPEQAEMESSFPWVETPGQVGAIEEVKRDLQTPHPMDRLICGDVGFGKTEVAIRAAFKVADAGRQVAVLCPTTILSEQHYRSFSDRLAGFPHKVALLNRFTTAKRRREVYEGMERGDIDIIIGTHALLNKSLTFSHLGLLIIDEEQKFGVKHKEQLKSLRASVDVLSMSATPIPRTLSMAMMAIRQMSVINDPPPGRLPVRTFVRPYASEVVREAILREMARGGQVFYVVNRVQGIEHAAEAIRKLVPSAKIAVGHGQMKESELEPVMMGFIAGEIDILISTTIVESGLDIPNANTMIVESADRFGLSQLYQLRGRVGRSDRQAYSYFLYPSKRSMTEGAMERLQALAEMSQLGSGYNLAVRDLQIRGAGDLLGKKQSGQMAAVGYDLYTQLIDAEVDFLKDVADGRRADAPDDPLEGLEPLPPVDLPVSAYIPEDYIEVQNHRLFYYKRLMGCRSLETLRELSAELTDRYGIQPPEVADAVAIIALRIRLMSMPFRQIEGHRQGLAAVPDHGWEMSPRLRSLLGKRLAGFQAIGERLVWSAGDDPIAGVERFLEVYEETLEQIDEERAALA